MSIRIWILIYSLLLFVPQAASSLSFRFNLSDPAVVDPCRGSELTCEGDAFQIPMLGSPPRTFSTGRVSYRWPVPLWNRDTGELASFATTFTFRMYATNASTVGKDWAGIAADGMAFFLGHYPSRIPDDSWGSNLGLLSRDNNVAAAGDARIVAVEFDTFGNTNTTDTTDRPHMGIDVNSIISVAYTNVGSGLSGGGVLLSAKITYDNATKLLAANLTMDGGVTWYKVSAAIDLRSSLPEEVAVGFSAATGLGVQVNEILSWTFDSTSPSVSRRRRGGRVLLLVAVLVPVLFATAAIALCCALLGFRPWRRHTRSPAFGGTGNGPAEEERDLEFAGEHGADEFEKGVLLSQPKRYSYRRLADATDNFAEENKLGRGGFGSVYRGRLSDQDGVAVAIKILSSESSSQGRKEFEAEVKIISQIRHRNLVRLLGWCDREEGLLLVYELVTEGGLDRHIHGTASCLTWPERYNIIHGLGLALRYLHEEVEQHVVHGDIKPSNIMLDSCYNAKLGDFGQARLIDPIAGPHTTSIIRGTMGYIDPELIDTKRPSIESDVYSFGVVLLEIISGRRPLVLEKKALRPQPDAEAWTMLLKWVRSLYGSNSLLDAVDDRLMGATVKLEDEMQMERVLVVGLWCTQPSRTERPSIGQAMHALNSVDAPLPPLQQPQPTGAQ